MAGTIGAIFTCALQLGSATGIAIITSIQTSIEASDGSMTTYRGRAAGFWFLFAFIAFSTLAVLIFMRNTVPPVREKKVESTGTSEDGDLSEGQDGVKSDV